MYGYGYSAYNRLSFLGGIDSNASAFFVATGITDPTIQGAIDTLCKDLKKYGVFDKMKAIYPFVGGTATTHKFNLVNPLDTNASFRLSFNGGWTHSSNGVLPNGTNGYANTFLTPSTSLSQNSTHISIYSRTNNSGNYGDIGSTNASFNDGLYILYRSADLKDYSRNNNSVSPVLSATTSLGYVINNRTTSTDMKVTLNNSVVNPNTNATTGLSTSNIFISAINVNGINSNYSNRQLAFATIGDGLTNTEASNLYTAVQKFQTTLGRQV